MIVYEHTQKDTLAGHTRQITVLADGDSKNRIVEQYGIHIQTPGISTIMTFNRSIAMDIISHLLHAIDAMDRHFQENTDE